MSSFGPHFISGIVVGGISTSIPFLFNFNITEPYQYCFPIVAGITGALTPDMDIKSKSSQIMYLLYLFGAGALYLQGQTDLGFLVLVYGLLPQFFKHRGFIHSILFGILSTFGIFGVLYYNTNNQMFSILLALTYFSGFLMHLILDE